MGSIKSLGLLKDIKNGEYRVVLTPAEVATLADDGISVMVASGAGYKGRSLTCYKGYLTHEETSGIQGRPWVSPEVILGIQGRHLDPAPPATKTKSDNIYPEFV